MITARAAARIATILAGSFFLSIACEDGGRVSCPDRVVASSVEIDDWCGCDGAGVLCQAGGTKVGSDECFCVAPQETCAPELEGGLVCGAGEKAYQCQGGAFVERFACPGLGQCFNGSSWSLIHCGTQDSNIAYAIEGGPCAVEQKAACTPLQDGVLNCQAGTWVRARTCQAGIERCELLTAGSPGVNCPPGSATCLGCGST